MQYQNEKTIREFVEIARGQIKTLSAICDRIELELDKPSRPAAVAPVATRTVYDWRGDELTPALREVYHLLKTRNHAVTINTICRELGIEVKAARWRLTQLRKAGVNVQTIRGGKPLAKYRIA
jgi:hypothetical protein